MKTGKEIEKVMINKKKELPKSFACINTNQKLWDKYIKWLDDGFVGTLTKYYGVTRHGTKYNDNHVAMFDTILSLEEWDEIVNGKQIKEEVMETIEITRIQLKEIYDIACNDWKNIINEYANRNPFGNTIKFTQKEVDAMFAASSNNIQKPVLESIFGKQSKDIDLSTGTVDGKTLFDNNRTLDNTLICVRDYGDYKYKAFILNTDYNWELVKDRSGNPCLVPTRK
jgi:hypothetical protein